MLISCIIPTYRREDLLARAVQSVLTQECKADIEIVVVNDAGQSLAVAEWQRDPRVSLINTNCAERCFARNAGAAMAHGEWLHFLDDDDVLLEGAYSALLGAVLEPAVWVQGATEVVTRDDEFVTRLYPSVNGDVFALSLISNPYIMMSALVKRSAFLSVGGFDPFFTNTEDRELFARIARCGLISCVHLLTSRVRAGNTNASLTQWWMCDQMDRVRRDKAFAISGCLHRIVRSLRGNPDAYVRGRIVRFYFGSALRHAYSGTISVTVSHLFAAGVVSLPGIWHPDFWCGVGRDKVGWTGRTSSTQ